jgi:hypothetical protein
MTSVPIWAGRILLSLLSTALLYVPGVPQRIPVVEEDASSRFVSREEGEAVVWVAWELRHGLGARPDCSHFVNLVYARAGFDYEYANTDAIFDGIDAFRRVQVPQAGDLVVWRGHVGLVVDPDEHSFYSSVRSGFAIEDYRSDYWTNRGRPRFYRYLTDETHSARLAAHLNTIKLEAPLMPLGPIDPLRPETEMNLHVANGPPVYKATLTAPPEDDTETSDVVFVSSNASPSKHDIRAALIRLADANADHVFQLPPSPSNRSVVAADQVTIDKLEILDHSGWADLEDQQAGARCLPGARNHTLSRWRLTLRHEPRGWILLVPRDRIYLRREAAARVLEHQPNSETITLKPADDPTGCESRRKVPR